MHQDKGGGHKGHIGTAKANQGGDEHCQPGTCEVCVWGVYMHTSVLMHACKCNACVLTCGGYTHTHVNECVHL